MANINAHATLGKLFGDLREIWIEIPGDCHLNCEYCFAVDNPEYFRFQKNGLGTHRIDVRKDLLTIDEIIENIRQFDEDFPLTEQEKKAGLKKRLAIPAAGEPFVNKRMRRYLYSILDFCKERDIVATVFTTGDKITEQDMDRLEQYGNNLKLFVKCNSKIPKVQDKLVGSKGYSYTQNRQKILERLIERGFNDGRLGVVTSIMKENLYEMEHLLRYARRNGLEFDADTIIDRGRGEKCKCKFSKYNDADMVTLRSVIEKLRAIDKGEFGKIWPEATSTYLGSEPCTRFDHHMYVKANGDVSPCVGSAHIIYGNTRENNLKELWNSKLSKVIRAHGVEGDCAGCKNYVENKCYSCLIRSIDPGKFTQEYLLKTGKIPTLGCRTCGPKE